MASIIYPTNDYAFHRIFGDEKHSEVLISFLNAVLEFPAEQSITTVNYMLPNQIPRIKSLKGTTLDIYVTDNSGRQFLVEMQVQYSKYFADRVLYYASRAFGNQLGKGEEYKLLKPVYFIGILKNFSISSGEGCISRHSITDTLTGENVLSKMKFYFLELQKFNKEDPSSLKGILEKWLFFLKYGSSNMEEAVIQHLPEAEFKKAVDITRKIAMDRRSLLEYDVADDAVRDLATREGESYDRGLSRGLSEGLSKGLSEGMSKGLSEGISKGLSKGISKGRADERAKIIRNLRASGMSPEDIAQNCKLTIEEVRNVLKNLG